MPSAEELVARTVFVAFTILATGGGFLVGRHFKGWRGGALVALVVLASMVALGLALRHLLTGLGV